MQPNRPLLCPAKLHKVCAFSLFCWCKPFLRWCKMWFSELILSSLFPSSPATVSQEHPLTPLCGFTHSSEFARWHSDQEPSCQCTRCKRGSLFDPWVRKIPWRRKWKPTPSFLPREFHGQRSLVGYSPWGCKESDVTEHTYTVGRYSVREKCLKGNIIHIDHNSP